MLVIQLTDTGRVLYTYCDTASLMNYSSLQVKYMVTVFIR